jgi:rubrerythrin
MASPITMPEARSRCAQEEAMNQAQLKELLLQTLEHQRGSIQVYDTALKCVVNDETREEWQEYLDQTRNHERILIGVLLQLSLDPEEDSPGRRIAKNLGAALVEAMQLALGEGDTTTAELIACECVVLAETKEHADWDLIAKCADRATGELHKTLKAAAYAVEDQADEHLYHSKGWCRELWLQSLGLRTVLPPPEQREHLTSSHGAAGRSVQR